jgi:hypothetical protein
MLDFNRMPELVNCFYVTEELRYKYFQFVNQHIDIWLPVTSNIGRNGFIDEPDQKHVG